MRLVITNLRRHVEGLKKMRPHLVREIMRAKGSELEYARYTLDYAERLAEESEIALAILEAALGNGAESHGSNDDSKAS